MHNLEAASFQLVEHKLHAVLLRAEKAVLAGFIHLPGALIVPAPKELDLLVAVRVAVGRGEVLFSTLAFRSANSVAVLVCAAADALGGATIAHVFRSLEGHLSSDGTCEIAHDRIWGTAGSREWRLAAGKGAGSNLPWNDPNETFMDADMNK